MLVSAVWGRVTSFEKCWSITQAQVPGEEGLPDVLQRDSRVLMFNVRLFDYFSEGEVVYRVSLVP